jgi:hypothetical protein
VQEVVERCDHIADERIKAVAAGSETDRRESNRATSLLTALRDHPI